jgi:hypothetical protein
MFPYIARYVSAADRVVVEQENFGHFLTALAGIQKHQCIRPSRHATDHGTIARQRDQPLAIFTSGRIQQVRCCSGAIPQQLSLEIAAHRCSSASFIGATMRAYIHLAGASQTNKLA